MTAQGLLEDGREVPVNEGGSSSGGRDDGLNCRSTPYTDNDLVTAVYDFVGDGADGAESVINGNGNAQRARRRNATELQERSITGPLPDKYQLATERLYSPTGKWVMLNCIQEFPDGGFQVEFNDLTPVGGDSITLGELFNQAFLELDPPVHGFELNPAGKQLVQFPTLFWIDQDYWNAERTTTKGNGNVFLTLTLVPFETEWDPGDGSDPVVCDGPGEVWERGLKGETFYCKHTYRSVEGQPFTVTSTVRFRLDTETNSNEVLGPFPSLERVDSVETGAREIQVVETNG